MSHIQELLKNLANAALEKLEKARKGEIEVDIKATLKELSFHIGGHIKPKESQKEKCKL